MSKYTIRYGYSKTGDVYELSNDIEMNSGFASAYPEMHAKMEALRACDNMWFAEDDEEPTDEVHLFSDDEVICIYRKFGYGSLNVMDANWVTNALAYALRVLNLTNEPDALSYVIDACKLIAEEDGDESSD